MFFFYDPLGLAKYFSPQSRVILYTLVYYIYSLRLLCSISGVKYLLCIQRVIIYNNCYCDYTFCTFIICHYFIIMHYFFVCMIEREREVNLLMRGVLRLCQVRCGQGDLDHRLFFFFFLLCRHLLACIVSTKKPNAVYMDACRLQLVGPSLAFFPPQISKPSVAARTHKHMTCTKDTCVQPAPVSDITTHTHNIVNMHVQVSLV